MSAIVAEALVGFRFPVLSSYHAAATLPTSGRGSTSIS